MAEHILSCSYGKDSLACIGACAELGWKIDRIVHAELWATDDIPADLPPMVEFKKKADKIIKERWGIDVEHICAMRNFPNPLEVGGTNALTRIPSTEKFQQPEPLNGQGNTIQIPNATMVTQPYTDSHSQSEHGVIQNSRYLSLPQLKKVTYQDLFYQKRKKGNRAGVMNGFPTIVMKWCNSRLKMPSLNFQNLMKVRWCNI